MDYLIISLFIISLILSINKRFKNKYFQKTKKILSWWIIILFPIYWGIVGITSLAGVVVILFWIVFVAFSFRQLYQKLKLTFINRKKEKNNIDY